MTDLTLTSPYDMFAAPGSRGTLTSHDSSAFTLSASPYRITFKSDSDSLKYNAAGKPIGGTVSSIELDQGAPDSLIFSISGISSKAATVYSLAKGAKSLFALEKLLLSGSDTIEGSPESDKLLGFAGADTLKGNGGDDTLAGGAGNDTLSGGVGADILDGGKGNDTASYGDSSEAVTVSLDPAGTNAGGEAQGDVLRNIENLVGSSNNDHLTGNSRANRLEGGAGADVMAGGRGNDVYVVDNEGDVVHESTKSGVDQVQSSISFDISGIANVENLKLMDGTAATIATGNELANRIEGNEQNNVLTGGGGKDVLIGGAGDDTYIVNLSAQGTPEDVVREASDGGADSIELQGTRNFKSAKAITLPLGVENLDVSATGVTKLNLIGNGLDNTLTGNEANNVLSGGAGKDALAGKGGNDTYVVSDADDVIVEEANQGDDLVNVKFSSGFTSFALGSNVENATVVSKTGGELVGNELDNTLKGGTGDDTLVGGVGADVLVGGDGSDTVSYADSVDPVVVTLKGAKAATASGGDAEGDSLTSIENVIGSNGADTLTGDGADNRLDGGAGADKLTGGGGDDTYIVDNVGDTVSEEPSSGLDTIESSIDFDLSVSGLNVENLILTGTDNIDGEGNEAANFLSGNEGNNTLVGGEAKDRLVGNGGVDSLLGGKDDDTYLIKVDPDTGGTEDTVTELQGEGTDKIDLYIDLAANFTKAVSYKLPANVENLSAEKIIANLQDKLLNIGLVGNTLENTITGNAGNNSIDGGDGNDKLIGGLGKDVLIGSAGNDTLVGGQGNDTLTGGADNDTFVFDSTPDNFNSASSASYKNVDHITDFVSGTDTIQLKQSLFSAAGTSGKTLSDAEFLATGSPSKNALQHIIYDTATGNLFYNSDGIGTAELVLIGVLDGHPALIAGDISFA